ncbi:MAG: biotin transporter BioY [Alphaproteobacteria bacterium]|nr:MAG: biotin transporter BioY [Alphaproteobacteria bacterium]|tara:strand:+ start:68 stop:658 length:591 start_codon:yes stop_codon:yes gene_type:complete
MDIYSSNNSLVSSLLGKKTNDFVYVLLTSIIGSFLLAISSKVQIPLTPVPVTLQTLVLLVMSMFLGWRGALGATSLYLFQGAIGLPVFAHGGGFIILFGPTGGYLFGFLIASLVVGYLAEKGWDKSVVLTFTSMTIGTLIIYLFGVIWLSYLKDLNTALVFGLLPFITPDILKICLGTCLVSAGWEISEKFINRKI